jgi:hypothetical protein
VSDGVRILAVGGACLLGALLAVGCVIAALFELQGFGGPRDAGPRAGYLLALAAGFVASVAVPVVLWRALLPDSAPAWAVVAVPCAIVVLVLLGVGIGR